MSTTINAPDTTDACHHCGTTVEPIHVIAQAPYPTRYWYRCCGLPWWNEG